MKTILTDLFYGNIRPQENLSSKPDYTRKHHAYTEKTKNFIEKLSPDMKEEFDKIISQKNELDLDDLEEMFCNGFCLGVQIMVEVYR